MRRQALAKRATPWFYLSPALVAITILSIGPMVWSAAMAFTDYSLYKFETYGFVGLDNFREILAGPLRSLFFPVFGWTLLYAVLATLTSYAVGLGLALLLNNRLMWETNIYRGLLIVPWALPGVVAILSMTGILNESYGFANAMLSKLGFGEGLPWITHANWAKVSVLLVNLWLSYPWFMSLTLGALQSIPGELYEAVEIDGGGGWQKFRFVTTPWLWSTSLPILISSIAFQFNNFQLAFLITGGGPTRMGAAIAVGHTDLLVSLSYKLTVQVQRYGLASAMSIILFVIVATISYINIRTSGSFREVD